MLEQVADAHGVVGTGVVQAENHDAEAGQDHRDNRSDLEQRQPELHLAEDFDVAQVQAANEEDDAQHPDPAGNFGKPEAHVNAESGHVGNTDDDHFKGIGPAQDEPRHRSQVGGGIAAERAGDRVVHSHFAEGAHDHEHRGAADQVGQQHGRAGHLDRCGRAIKQPGTDCRA
ncbi:hypothetical protein D3C76_1102250 [compost metagenome]